MPGLHFAVPLDRTHNECVTFCIAGVTMDLDQLHACQSQCLALDDISTGCGIADVMTAPVILDRESGITKIVNNKKINTLGNECPERFLVVP